MKGKAARLYLGRTEEDDRVYAEIQLNPMYQSHQRASKTYRKESVNHKIVPFDAVSISVTHERYGREVSFGASTDGFLDVVKPAKGLTLEEIKRLAELGNRWHLNGMRAGCAHQTVVWENHEQYGYRQPSHSKTLPCPITGYKYGHAWLSELAPVKVMAEFEAFMAKGKPIPAHNF
jgi:hypothetical protein